MSAQVSSMEPVIDGMVGRTIPASVNVLSLGMIGLGAIAFLVGLFAIGDGGAVAWGSFLVGLVYTLALAQGGVMFAVLMSGTWGRWGRPVKRIAEAFGFFLPIAYVALIVFLLFGLKIYPWNPNTIAPGGPVDLHPHSAAVIAAKPFWLSPWFFRFRELFAVGLMLVLDFLYLRSSLVPDLMIAKARLGSRAPAWWDRLIAGRTDIARTLNEALNLQARLAPILGWAYALIMSLVAFDLIMSLSPSWAANMFGAWVTVSGFYLTLAAIGFTAMIGKDWLGIAPFIRTNVTHDLGKLMMVGAMFWAYTGFAQLLPIWYTDMPEETNFLLVRLFLPEWTWLAQTVAILCFVAPFTILLSLGSRRCGGRSSGSARS